MNENYLSLRKFTRIVKSRYKLIAASVFLTILTANIFDEITPVTFSATSTVIVDFKDPVSTNSPLPALLQEDFMETQLGIIKSKFMAEKVIDYLHLDQQPGLQEIYDGFDNKYVEFRNWLSTFLLQQLSVYVYKKNTRLIKIGFQSESQQKAIEIANAFADIYIRTTLDLNLTPLKQTAKWFEEQLEPLRRELESAETKLAQYQQERNILGGDSVHSDSEIEKLGLLTNDWAKSQTELKNLETLVLQINQFKDISDFEKLAVFVDSQYLLRIKNELIAKENGLIEISNLYGKNHPNYQGYISELNNLRGSYAQELESYAETLNLKLKSLMKQEEELQAALVAQRKLVFDKREEGGELPILERELESARINYKETFEQFQDYTLRSRASQSNVTLLNPANMDVSYKNVEKKNVTILGLFLGLFIGVFLAVIWEYLNGRILDETDLQNALDVPFIGVIGAK